MKYLVFVEDATSRRQIEELLTATSLPYETLALDAILEKGRTEAFTTVVTEYETWQRHASILRYFDCLESLNQKPFLVFNKLKKQGGLKLRRAKGQTVHSPLPAQAKDVQPLLLQLG